MSTITHSDKAQAVARETGWDLDGFAAENDWAAVGLGPVGQHRDSGALDVSNFAVVLADLTERFGDAVTDVRFSHWAVGWVEEIAYDASRPDVAATVAQWRDALDDYPVADEAHYYELEYADAIDTLKNCSWGTVPGEMADELPDDWAEQAFSYLFDHYSHCRGEDYCDADVTEALIALSFYVVEPS